MAAADTPPAAALAAQYRVEFSGTAGEYFRIWIVNLAFSILTLGLYSPWAKVRKKRYLYLHTQIDGDSFEYRGNPVAILKGRLLGGAVAATVYGVSHFLPAYWWVLVPVGVFLVPWLLVRSLAFNAVNSRFRNIRFRFHGRYGRCWRILAGYGLLTVVTLGIGYYYLKTRITEFILREHAYGASAFDVRDLKKPFFAAYTKMVGLSLLGMVALFAISMSVFSFAGVRSVPSLGAIWTVNIFSYAVYLAIFAYIRSRILNATWDNVALGRLRFRCTLSARKLYALYVVNILAIVATAGLATPWAVIRTLRYRAEQFAILAPEGLDGFAAREGGDVGAAGEEVAEMLDMDFSL